MSGKKYINTDDNKLCELYLNELKSTTEISQITGLTPSTIRRRLLKLNVLRSPADGLSLVRYKINEANRGRTVNMTDEWRNNISIGQIKRWDKTSKGYCLKPNGYYEITRGKNKGRMLHDVIYEQFYNMKLDENDIVHHINGKRTDNDIRNLARMTRSEHCSLHAKENYKNRTINKKGQFA